MKQTSVKSTSKRDSAIFESRWRLGNIVTPEDGSADIPERHRASMLLQRIYSNPRITIKDIELITDLAETFYKLGQLDYRKATRFDKVYDHRGHFSEQIYLRRVDGGQLPEDAEYFVLRGDRKAPPAHIAALVAYARLSKSSTLEEQIRSRIQSQADLEKKINGGMEPPVKLLEHTVDAMVDAGELCCLLESGSE